MDMGILPTNSLYQKVYQLCLNGKDLLPFYLKWKCPWKAGVCCLQLKIQTIHSFWNLNGNSLGWQLVTMCVSALSTYCQYHQVTNSTSDTWKRVFTQDSPKNFCLYFLRNITFHQKMLTCGTFTLTKTWAMKTALTNTRTGAQRGSTKWCTKTPILLEKCLVEWNINLIHSTVLCMHKRRTQDQM